MGRPRVDTHPVTVRLHQDVLDRIDAHRGNLSRPKAIRNLIEKGLNDV